MEQFIWKGPTKTTKSRCLKPAAGIICTLGAGGDLGSIGCLWDVRQPPGIQEGPVSSERTQNLAVASCGVLLYI